MVGPQDEFKPKRDAIRMGFIFLFETYLKTGRAVTRAVKKWLLAAVTQAVEM
jgi:hypothetical protein